MSTVSTFLDTGGMPATITMMATGPEGYAEQDLAMAGMPATIPMMVGPTAWPAIAPEMGLATAAEQHIMDADAWEVLTAVESLYIDELKPYGRILRKRLAEHAVLAGRGAVVIGIQSLKEACETNLLLTVQPEEGGEWSVLLKGRPSTFVDVYSPIDIYPPSLWTAADAYFRSLDNTNMVLPGGRYSCARVLVSRCLPFLAGRSLGQVCHIVQLAISQKKLLGYLHGAVVPYACSQSMVKEQCAEWQRPCTSSGDSTVKVADWDAVRSILEKIIESMPPGTDSIPLSNLKRVFRSRYGVELSETSLGYSKLSALFQDPRLHDLCSVRLQGHGYVVEPLRSVQPAPPGAVEPAVSSPHQPRTVTSPAKSSLTSPSAISIADSLAGVGPKMMRLRQEAAKDAAASLGARARPAPLTLEDIMAPRARVGTPVQLQSYEYADFAAAAAAEAASLFPPTPAHFPATPSPSYALSLPRLLGNSQNSYMACHLPRQLEGADLQSYMGKQMAMGLPSMAECAAASDTAMAAEAAARAVATHALQMEMESCFNAAAAAGMGSLWMQRPLTPGALGNLGYRVQNTFINAAVPPTTPLGAGPLRANSQPRSMRQEFSPLSPAAYAAPR
eukprot:CAMPEP_0195081278 /NCGR_PEP_ID=MMETSP0448-20130528/22769_1 /TAXON_ID=66468 /ORGANISM="Heterocapsa triquestra, Strain CCMP 448" /LENGTH=616 /DNA_ID=CAMNT_0040114291 /DNA_START=8 /DNA_END=1858 /DNA_ORIENTATION=+